MCYHIVRWYDSVRCGPALKTCYRTKSTAQTIRHRGIVGDRSPFHLEAHDADTNPLGVVQCRNAEHASAIVGRPVTTRRRSLRSRYGELLRASNAIRGAVTRLK